MYRWVGGVGSARGRAAGQDRCVGVRRRRRQEQVRRTVCGAVGVVLVSCSESGCLPVLAALQGEGDWNGSGLSSGERIRRSHAWDPRLGEEAPLLANVCHGRRMATKRSPGKKRAPRQPPRTHSQRAVLRARFLAPSPLLSKCTGVGKAPCACNGATQTAPKESQVCSQGA